MINPITIAIAVVIFAVFSLCFFKFGGNIYGFFRIGSILPLSPYLDRQNALIFQGELGFDGQQFLSLAFDPFLHDPDTLSTLDSPRLRYRRILYPFLGYCLGFGNLQLIPYVLIGINVLAIIFLVWLVGQDLKQTGRSTWQSLGVLCIPGVWIVLVFSTADLLNSLLGVAALYGYKKQKKGFCGLAIAAAFLTKEISVMLGVALLLSSIREKNWQQIPYLVAAFIPATIWHTYVLFKLRSQGFLGVAENLGYPFIGIGQKIWSLGTGGFSGKNLFEVYSFFLLVGVFAVTLIISMRFPK
ncbi:MAG: hypothetical protein SVX43_03770, partial [Cyanobacteriota bacterium]|nr:hypothetical protein [Cyanobacteriota bacterium]